MNVKLPRTLALKGHVGVGNVHVRGMDKDIAIDVGVGDVRLAGKSVLVRSVSLDVGGRGREAVSARRESEGHRFRRKQTPMEGWQGQRRLEGRCGRRQCNCEPGMKVGTCKIEADTSKMNVSCVKRPIRSAALRRDPGGRLLPRDRCRKSIPPKRRRETPKGWNSA